MGVLVNPGFARKHLYAGRCLTQRRKGAKRYRVSKGFLCAFAPLRETPPVFLGRPIRFE